MEIALKIPGRVVFKVSGFTNEVYVPSEIALVGEGHKNETQCTQGWDTYKAWAMSKFLMEGKRITRIEHNTIYVECDDIDAHFLRIAKRFSATNWKIWVEVIEMLERGVDRREVLKYLEVKYIAKVLRGGK